MTNESTVKGPWYRYFREEVGKANGFIAASSKSSKEIDPETYITFQRETLATFIFESNHLEKEGLPLGETRELVFTELDNFTRVDFNSVFDSGLYSSMETLNKIIDEQNESNRIQYPSNRLEIFHKGKNKKPRIVSQQLCAALVANSQTIIRDTQDKDIEIALYWIFKRFPALEKNFHNQNLNIDVINSLLDEDIIRILHKIMANGLIESKYAPAGEYREHIISTDMESHYPAPGDVPRAMEKFIEQFQALEQEYTNPIVLAAWASTQFVLIHPFSDFNGRMSRLIANMVLRSYGVPFWTSLRSTKKERGRYITALRHYRRDSPRSIATLIAKQVNYNFEEFNKILSLSGYEPIVPSPEFKDLSAEALETKKFLPYSEQAKQKYEAAVPKSQQ